MSDFKRLIAGIGCRDGRAIRLDSQDDIGGFFDFACACSNSGADGLLVCDKSGTDQDHESTIGLIKAAARAIDIPIIAGGRVKRLEDVKKYLYAGAKAVYLDGGNEDNVDLIKEAADRFGGEKIYVLVSDSRQLARVPEFGQLGASVVILDGESDGETKRLLLEAQWDAARETDGAAAGVDSDSAGDRLCGGSSALDDPSAEAEQEQVISGFLVVSRDSSMPHLASCLETGCSGGAVLLSPEPGEGRYMEMKQQLGARGIPVDILRSSISWDQFKLNSDGLVPVIVQDYKTSEVLMLAYMNEQAFADTLRTGKMHYYSRSRKSQWQKGETSGHYQYVKSLHLDCDNDTVLAKVHQIGAACHTGARSCFFQTLAQKEYRETNPLKVFEDVFSVILDRKENPKEGSYTNYLFDKGIDKILKKVGEEATEIVIAAKNPDPEEIKYEISDFLYHVMVLMAEKGVTWEEITEELANR